MLSKSFALDAEADDLPPIGKDPVAERSWGHRRRSSREQDVGAAGGDCALLRLLLILRSRLCLPPSGEYIPILACDVHTSQ